MTAITFLKKFIRNVSNIKWLIFIINLKSFSIKSDILNFKNENINYNINFNWVYFQSYIISILNILKYFIKDSCFALTPFILPKLQSIYLLQFLHIPLLHYLLHRHHLLLLQLPFFPFIIFFFFQSCFFLYFALFFLLLHFHLKDYFPFIFFLYKNLN